MLRTSLLALLFVISLPSRADNILILGDSLSAAYGIPIEQGWVQLLQNRLDHLNFHYQVINASISGETSQGGLTRLPSLLAEHSPSHVIIELGANDGLRGLPPTIIESTLSKLVVKTQLSGANTILLGMQLPANYGPFYQQKFSQLFPKIAQTYNIPLVPNFMEQVALQPEMMQADKLHPNTKGQPVLLENIWPYLEKTLKK